MPKLNINPGLVAELRARIEKQTNEQQPQVEAAYKALVEAPGSSHPEMASTSQTQASDSIVYADLAFSETSRKEPELKPVEDNTEYAEIISTGYIEQSKTLLRLTEDIKATDRKIAGIKKLKELKQPENNLALIEEELKKNHDSKLNLQTKLLKIRTSLHEEFNINFLRLQKKETEIQERIENTHGDVNKYNQLTSELFQTRNLHIRLIQENIAFEQGIVNSSKDDLKASADIHLYALYNEELGLQNNLLAALQEKKDIIGHNIQLHLPGTPQFEDYSEQFHETVNDLVNCKDRILILKDEITIRDKAFQSEEVEFIEIGALNINFPSILEENPCYEQEPVQPTQAGPFAQEGSNLSGPMVDRSKKPNIDFSKKPEDPLVEQRQQPTGDENKRVQFTKSTIERDDKKETEKAEAESKNPKAANPTTLRSRLEEFSTIWQTPEDKSELVTDPAPPAVKRELKPSRLNRVNLFSNPIPDSSLSADQGEREKEKNKKGFACKQ